MLLFFLYVFVFYTNGVCVLSNRKGVWLLYSAPLKPKKCTTFPLYILDSSYYIYYSTKLKTVNPPNWFFEKIFFREDTAWQSLEIFEILRNQRFRHNRIFFVFCTITTWYGGKPCFPLGFALYRGYLHFWNVSIYRDRELQSLRHVSCCNFSSFATLKLSFGYVSDLGCLPTCVYLHCGVEQWVEPKSDAQNFHISEFADLSRWLHKGRNMRSLDLRGELGALL